MKKLTLVLIMILLVLNGRAIAESGYTDGVLAEEGSGNFVDPAYGALILGTARDSNPKDYTSYTSEQLKEIQERISAGAPAGSVGGSSPNAAEGAGIRGAVDSSSYQPQALTSIWGMPYMYYVYLETIFINYGYSHPPYTTPKMLSEYDYYIWLGQNQQIERAAYYAAEATRRQAFEAEKLSHPQDRASNY